MAKHDDRHPSLLAVHGRWAKSTSSTTMSSGACQFTMIGFFSRFLILEGAQAGLSWATILKKRQNYREAFERFDPTLVARFGKEEQASLMANEGIVRNRLKIGSAIDNARAFLVIQQEFGSFDQFIWEFVDRQPLQNAWHSINDVHLYTSKSDAMSQELKRCRGFRFV